MPAATAAALPPLEPPGSRSGLRGLRVTPSADCVNPHTASSGIRVLPTTTAPARRSRLTSSSSRRAGAVEAAADPCRVGCPATGTLSFTATGTPASGRANRSGRASTPAASASTRSASTASKAPSSAVTGGDAGQVRTGDLDGGRGPGAHPSRRSRRRYTSGGRR